MIAGAVAAAALVATTILLSCAKVAERNRAIITSGSAIPVLSPLC